MYENRVVRPPLPAADTCSARTRTTVVRFLVCFSFRINHVDPADGNNNRIDVSIVVYSTGLGGGGAGTETTALENKSTKKKINKK